MIKHPTRLVIIFATYLEMTGKEIKEKHSPNKFFILITLFMSHFEISGNFL